MISKARLGRMRQQGYENISNDDLAKLHFGNRFAYMLCTSVLIIGVATASVHVLLAMMTIAFGTIILPYHPFDYIYNGLLRGILRLPKLPPRSKQLKFACTIASAWIGATTLLFYFGMMTAGYLAGGMLICVATLVSTTDICIPSIVYNLLFKVRIEGSPDMHQ